MREVCFGGKKDDLLRDFVDLLENSVQLKGQNDFLDLDIRSGCHPKCDRRLNECCGHSFFGNFYSSEGEGCFFVRRER